MPDELIVSGGGSFAVATETVWQQVVRLRRATECFEQARAHVMEADRYVTAAGLTRADAPISASRAESDMQHALAALGRLVAEAHLLERAVRVALEAYGAADAAANQLIERAQAWVAQNIGRILPMLLITLFPGTAGAVAGWLVGALLERRGAQHTLDTAAGALAEERSLLTHPVTAWVLRSVVSDLDETIAGALGVPAPVVELLGERGLGVLGVASSSALAVALGSAVGVYRETPIETRRTATAHAAPPTGFADRFSRIPAGADQIRIERQAVRGAPDRFSVYIGATADFSPVAGDEPFDSTSNLWGSADLPSGSERAVRQAMADAGVTAATPVEFTGYSQGGLVAARLAASGDYATEGLVTFGAPTAQIDVPASVPAVAVEHTDDLVPAAGGRRESGETVLVERQAFAGREVPEEWFPAHARDEYRHTAELMDAAQAPPLAQHRAGWKGDREGPVTVYEYRAERISAAGGRRADAG